VSESSVVAGAVSPDAAPGETPATARGELTRARILDTALDLFRERGYDDTTMRVIAARAGVSLGNAYYYFRSKEHLIQAFYGRTHAEHLAACGPVLERERTFRNRLRGVMVAKLDTLEPYHRFAGILFKTAADPASPLHPLSEASRPVREEATALFREVVEGSTLTSAGRARSRRLVDGSVGLIDRLVAISKLPLLGRIRRQGMQLVRELEG